jgi:hypothetical protein
MFRTSATILIVIAATMLLTSACGRDEIGGSILQSDETEAAGEIVHQVNQTKLRPIKERFRENEPRLEELQTALKAKDVGKVKSISGELVDAIDGGLNAGREAIDELRKAQDLNINDDYKQYLELKIEALEKYIEAFEERKKAAKILRDGYDPKNSAMRDKALAEFKNHDEKFKEIMEEGRRISDDANVLAKESLNRGVGSK